MRVLTTMGSLSCEVVQLDDAPPKLVVVLCHGFGAPANDLVPLAGELIEAFPALAPVRFVFPGAPLSMVELGYGDARAWWHLDMQRLALLQQGGEAELGQLRREVPEGLARSRRLLLGLIEELTRTTGLGIGRLVLGGFSQGAMLATDVALRLDEAVGGLVLLSGTLLNEEDWRRRAPTRAGLHVFQSHGQQDPILPFANALALHQMLDGAGLKTGFLPFEGGHTITVEVLQQLGTFLAARV